MTKIFATAIACLFLIHTAFSQEKNYYTDYDATSILKLSAANQELPLDSFDYALLDALLFHLTNLERAKAHLPLYIHNEQLQKAAQWHSTNMVKKDFYGHEDKTTRDSKTYINRISKFGEPFPVMSENILYTNIYNTTPEVVYYSKKVKGKTVFYNSKTNQEIKICTYAELAKKLVKQWMDSKHHKENILKKEHKYLGVSAVIDLAHNKADELLIVKATQDFGG